MLNVLTWYFLYKYEPLFSISQNNSGKLLAGDSWQLTGMAFFYSVQSLAGCLVFICYICMYYLNKAI